MGTGDNLKGSEGSLRDRWARGRLSYIVPGKAAEGDFYIPPKSGPKARREQQQPHSTRYLASASPLTTLRRVLALNTRPSTRKLICG